MKKKKIIGIIIGIIVVVGLIVGLVFFLNRDKTPTQDLDPEPTPPAVEETTKPEESTKPEVKPSYLDNYEAYTSLPGIEFNLPKSIMAEATPIKDIKGSLNGETALYKTPNTLAIKKIGSLMFGISYYEKPGIYDAMYVSSITGLDTLKITEDMSFNFKDINFNSTSFNTSKLEGQKRSVISVKMVEPEYTNDTYSGYFVLIVNSQNKGYLAFIASTGTELSNADVQSMVNSIVLTGKDVSYTEPVPDKVPLSLNVNMNDKIFVAGDVVLDYETDKTSSKHSFMLNEKAANMMVVVLPGKYKISGEIEYKDLEADETTKKVKFSLDSDTVDITKEFSASVELNTLIEKAAAVPVEKPA